MFIALPSFLFFIFQMKSWKSMATSSEALFFFGLADQTCWSSRARIKRQKRGELPYVYLMMLWSTAVKRPLSKHLHISVLLKLLLAVGSMYLFNLFEQILWYVPSFPIGSLQWWEFRCSSGLPRWLELCHCVVKLIMGLI